MSWTKTLRRRVMGTLGDFNANRRFAGDDGRFLIVRHPAVRPGFYDVFLRWVETRLPRIRRRIELQLLPHRPRDMERIALLVPWLQDPVASYSPAAHRQALELSAALAEHGVPTINPVERLAGAAKSAGAERVRAAGIRAPHSVRIRPGPIQPQLGDLELPVLIREDLGHAGPDALEAGEVVLCTTAADLRAVDPSRFEHPVALEFIDTRDPRDGLYRKYRYVVAGDVGAPYHTQVQDHWFVKGRDAMYSAALHAEDLAYLSEPDPNHDRLVRAAREIGLDVLAFDYGYTPDGELVVFEANPQPFIQFLRGRRRYRGRAVERTFAAFLHLYHTRAGLDVPDEVHQLLEFSGDEDGAEEIQK